CLHPVPGATEHLRLPLATVLLEGPLHQPRGHPLPCPALAQPLELFLPLLDLARQLRDAGVRAKLVQLLIEAAALLDGGLMLLPQPLGLRLRVGALDLPA